MYTDTMAVPPWLGLESMLEDVQFSTGPEKIMRGSRAKFPQLKDLFLGMEQISLVGWGSQAPAQAQNIRDSLRAIDSDIRVKVGLRNGSRHWLDAIAAGFQPKLGGGDGTLDTIEEVVKTSDMVLLLISDEGATKIWKQVTDWMKPGATLGISHGFIYAHLDSIGASIRPDINIVMMAPKGMGPSVRRLYLQGAATDGAGINASVAIWNDATGSATDRALGWSLAVGSPVTFFTTVENEVKSDLVGERSMLLAGICGVTEAVYEYFIARAGLTPKEAFMASTKGLTSTVSQLISDRGLLGMYESLDVGCQATFTVGYRRTYASLRALIEEIYSQVSSWREVAEVVSATEALAHTPMTDIEKNSPMWAMAKENSLYEKEPPVMNRQLALTAGIYIAGIMAQLDVLREHGHSTSEMINESLIEAIDSLNPFTDKRGIAYMVDNCSTTARLGGRKWGPRFKQVVLDACMGDGGDGDNSVHDAFLVDPIHADIAKCYKLRPSVRIALD